MRGVSHATGSHLRNAMTRPDQIVRQHRPAARLCFLTLALAPFPPFSVDPSPVIFCSDDDRGLPLHYQAMAPATPLPRVALRNYLGRRATCHARLVLCSLPCVAFYFFSKLRILRAVRLVCRGSLTYLVLTLVLPYWESLCITPSPGLPQSSDRMP
jgi:hypothetical protein